MLSLGNYRVEDTQPNCEAQVYELKPKSARASGIPILYESLKEFPITLHIPSDCFVPGMQLVEGYIVDNKVWTPVEDLFVQLDSTRPWVDVDASGLDESHGYHVYVLKFLKESTYFYLWFSYYMQSDYPTKPYIYYESSCKENKK